jgi:hypothetical protein
MGRACGVADGEALDADLTRRADAAADVQLEDDMWRHVILISMISMAVGRPLLAQHDSLVAVGDRVRLTVGTDSAQVEGALWGVRGDALLLRRDAATLEYSLDSVSLVERAVHSGFDHKGALKGAAIGAGVGAAIAAYGLAFDCTLGEQGIAGECHGQSAGEAVLFAGALTGGGALLGGLVGGGGRNAKRGALVGFMAGAVVGAAVGAASYQEPDCAPDAFMCLDFGPGLEAMAGAMVAGAAGGLVGLAAGALAGDTEWVPVSVTGLQLGVVPTPGGMRLAGSFAF